MKHLLTLLAALAITLSAGAQTSDISTYKSAVDASIINQTAVGSVTRAAVGGRFKDLADIVAGRTDTNRVATVGRLLRTDIDSVLKHGATTSRGVNFVDEGLGTFIGPGQLTITDFDTSAIFHVGPDGSVSAHALTIVNPDYPVNVLPSPRARIVYAGSSLTDVPTDTIRSSGTIATTRNVDSMLSPYARKTDIAGSYATQTALDATNAAVAGKEPAISAGTSFQYLRGDKTWQTLYATGAVPMSALNATGTASSSTYLRGDGTWATAGSNITGLNQNYLPKATAGNTIGNSQVADNGTTVSINQPNPNSYYKLDVKSDAVFGMRIITEPDIAAPTGYAALAPNEFSMISKRAMTGITILNYDKSPGAASALRFASDTLTNGNYYAEAGFTYHNDTKAFDFSGASAGTDVPALRFLTNSSDFDFFSVYLNKHLLYVSGFRSTVGIGTNTPRSALTVAGGDIQVTDISKGIILPSPNGTCWRVTIDNTGALTSTSVPCP